MKLLTTIPYESVNFLFIIDHWDIHLRGLCIYNESVKYFETISGTPSWTPCGEYPKCGCSQKDYNDCFDHKQENVCKIYELIPEELEFELQKKRDFEKWVGLNWTYVDGELNKGKLRPSKDHDKFYRKYKYN